MLGTDTGDCMAGGAQQAVAGMTERVHKYLKRVHDFDPQIVLTGSDAEIIAGQLELPYHCRHDLVLQGLACLKD
jgi:pantothenate kinase type III